MHLRREVVRVGAGIHSGEIVSVRLVPGERDAGVRFWRGQQTIPASVRFAEAGEGCTLLRRGTALVATPEHLLAAFAGLRVTDVDVIVEGGAEIPILDGAASAWVAAIDEAGRVPARRYTRQRPKVPVEVTTAGGKAGWRPGHDGLDIELSYAGGPSGSWSCERNETVFREKVAPAKTFVRESDIDAMRAAGRGKAASPSNTLAWREGDPIAPLMRHKALDAWGDLSLAGPLEGRLWVKRGSHALHLALARALAAAL